MKTSGDFSLSRDSFGRLVLTDFEGHRHVGIEPIRAFPLSDPERGISLCDESGHEVFWVESLTGLPPSLRSIVEEELAAKEFVPTIARIDAISGESAPSDWDVVTDRGRTRFTLDADEQVRKLDRNRVLIADSLGLRYQVPDWKRLDASSRRLLERYL